MVTHVVLFRVQKPYKENAQAIAEQLKGMEGKVAGLDSIEVGLNLNTSEQAADVCLITRHADWKALTTYQADPLHREVKEFIAERASGVQVVDFESQQG